MPDIEIRRARIRPLVIRIRVVQRVRERTRYVLGEFMISAGQLEWITYGSWRDSGIGAGLFFGDGDWGVEKVAGRDIIACESLAGCYGSGVRRSAARFNLQCADRRWEVCLYRDYSSR